MDSFDSRLVAAAREALEDHIADAKSQLVHPAALDYATYREKVGFIRGLLHAIDVLRSASETLKEAGGHKPEQRRRESYES